MMNGKANDPAASIDIGEWDNDGGALGPVSDRAIHAGIAQRRTTEYLVGRYRYSDLSLAIAERDRQAARANDRKT